MSDERIEEAKSHEIRGSIKARDPVLGRRDVIFMCIDPEGARVEVTIPWRTKPPIRRPEIKAALAHAIALLDSMNVLDGGG